MALRFARNGYTEDEPERNQKASPMDSRPPGVGTPQDRMSDLGETHR